MKLLRITSSNELDINNVLMAVPETFDIAQAKEESYLDEPYIEEELPIEENSKLWFALRELGFYRAFTG